MTHQAMMLHLDVGQWSGFNRKMEIAESFVQPLLTVSLSCNLFWALLTCWRCFDGPEERHFPRILSHKCHPYLTPLKSWIPNGDSSSYWSLTRGMLLVTFDRLC